jgi:GTPase KRas protein
VVDGQTVLVEVMDHTNQEEYCAMLPQALREADGVMIIYSITSRKSFEAIGDRLQEIHRSRDADYFPVTIVGTMCDLSSEREVLTEEAGSYAREIGCPFLETSAKSCINVDASFHTMVREIRWYSFSMKPLGERKDNKALLRQSRGPSCSIM